MAGEKVRISARIALKAKKPAEAGLSSNIAAHQISDAK